eukprot:CAMPEP_0181141234 /NCGR_PEP_ID=MMETSP1071-20121207/35718_1 /TAXON_ID=35127 /ORGANISM="Thalassiosira sp., Strain NH16" /LENGTH=164 /DNA_ID=CAMNT_0023228217 /DNA_START=450 /DNA_END=944 /DNA_ORIENTATION=+
MKDGYHHDAASKSNHQPMSHRPRGCGLLLLPPANVSRRRVAANRIAGEECQVLDRPEHPYRVRHRGPRRGRPRKAAQGRMMLRTISVQQVVVGAHHGGHRGRVRFGAKLVDPRGELSQREVGDDRIAPIAAGVVSIVEVVKDDSRSAEVLALIGTGAGRVRYAI